MSPSMSGTSSTGNVAGRVVSPPRSSASVPPSPPPSAGPDVAAPLSPVFPPDGAAEPPHPVRAIVVSRTAATTPLSRAEFMRRTLRVLLLHAGQRAGAFGLIEDHLADPHHLGRDLDALVL